MRYLALLLCLLVSPCLQAAEIVALGASNTEGRGRGRTNDGVARGQAFPAQLQKQLAAQGCRAKVLNAGIAGDTTDGMLRRLPRVIAKDTRVLILQPGGNDRRRGLGDQREENISAIRAYAEQRGIKVVMLDRLQRLAPAALLPDGQHFNEQGHITFAEHLLPQVAGTVCR